VRLDSPVLVEDTIAELQLAQRELVTRSPENDTGCGGLGIVPLGLATLLLARIRRARRCRPATDASPAKRSS
jgi:hypothetical protein